MEEAEKALLEATVSKFNLEKGLASNLVKSEPATRKAFFDVIKFSGLTEGEKKIGNMLYSIATKLPVTIQKYREPLSVFVGKGDISNPNQLDFTIDYLKNHELKGGVDIEKLKKDCGIGIKLTNEQINVIIEKHIATATEKSKKFDFLAKIKQEVPFVQGKILKDAFDAAWKGKGLPDVPVVEKEKKIQKKVEKMEAEEEVFHIKDISELIGR